MRYVDDPLHGLKIASGGSISSYPGNYSSRLVQLGSCKIVSENCLNSQGILTIAVESPSKSINDKEK